MTKVKYIVNCADEEVQRAWNLYKEFDTILNEKIDYDEPDCHFWLWKPDTGFYEEEPNITLLGMARAVLDGVSHLDVNNDMRIYAFDYEYGKNRECKGLACWVVQARRNTSEKEILNNLVLSIKQSYVDSMRSGFDVFVKEKNNGNTSKAS